ncbi:hypothetical protein AK812_SmicGene43328 [Symbiodinium microadriaticum]|uniref:Uncharacterized protein n=1 Tax=Symbiodinium microadriaticum TaxID=2951 RepID=A0A1Q9C1A5_SYMMI|nr:hypothetical protein AK812_SmicGene43328 [Symbiodinium microadriaticum]
MGDHLNHFIEIAVRGIGINRCVGRCFAVTASISGETYIDMSPVCKYVGKMELVLAHEVKPGGSPEYLIAGVEFSAFSASCVGCLAGWHFAAHSDRYLFARYGGDPAAWGLLDGRK